jgi:hypothetical protein
MRENNTTSTLSPVKAITFAVSDVALADKPLAERPYAQALAATLNSPIEACSQQNKALIVCRSHPLMTTAHYAFADHRPLIIAPDHIWLIEISP